MDLLAVLVLELVQILVLYRSSSHLRVSAELSVSLGLEVFR
jgi:hypothetical protein